jgi:2'-5' RNA ligase
VRRLGWWRRRREAGTAHSAVIVPVPEAARLLHACGLPPDGLGTAPGMPAHVTLLYPFVAPSELDDTTVGDLGRIIATGPAFDFALTRFGRFPGVLYLAPEPAEPFITVTRAIVDRWPEHPPYRGAYDAIVPHVTLVHGQNPPAGLEARIQPALPVSASAAEVSLMVEGPDGIWRSHTRFPLRGS